MGFKINIRLLAWLFLFANLAPFMADDAYAHSCTGTRVGTDTTLHDSGISNDVAYQEWHASFRGKNRCRSYEGRSIDYIDISDDDGNSDRVNNPGDYYTVETTDYSWLEDDEDVTVYFHANGVSSSSITKRMPENNDPPSASFTENSPKNTGSSIYFDARGSSDSDGSINSYRWDWDNDNNYEGSGSTDYHSYSEDGSYTVTLRVTDNDGANDYYSRTVTVNNRNPSASFTDNGAVMTSEDFGLDASGSSDPDGSVNSYAWDTDNDGSYDDASGSSPSVSKSDDGSYTIGLKVTDNDGSSSTTSKSITVNNRNPSASFTEDGPKLTGNSINFDAGGSSDPDGSIASYEWDWTNDGSYDTSGASPGHSYPEDGTYTVKLRVTDDDGATATSTGSVTVNNRNPTASYNYNPSDPSLGEQVNFDASGSNDQDGSISNYEWDWADDGIYEGSGSGQTQSFSNPGDYTVVLRVTDNDGAQSTFSSTVSVTDQTNPIISNPSPTSVIADDTPTISADFSDNYQLSSYTLQIDGTQVDSGSLSGSADSVSYTSSELSYSSHTFNWTVEDQAGNTVSVQRSFTVNSPPNKPTLETPNNGDIVRQDQDLNVTVSDPEGDNLDVDLIVNGSTNSTIKGVNSGETVSFNPPLEKGSTYEWSVRATDTKGSSDTSNVRSFTVNSPPNILSTASNPNPPKIGEQNNYSASVSDDEGNFKNITLTILDDGSQVYSDTKTNLNPSWNNVYIPTEGSIEVKYVVKDTFGAEKNASNSWSLTETQPIQPEINNPQNITYNVEEIPYSVKTFNDTDDNVLEQLSCDILESGVEKSSHNITEGESFSGTYNTTSEGSQIFKVDCFEKDGENNFNTTNYNVDFVKPVINAFSLTSINPQYEETVGANIDATDNKAISNVNITVKQDNSIIAEETKSFSTDSISATFNDLYTANKTNSKYTVTVEVIDNQGKISSQNITHYLDNTPPSFDSSTIRPIDGKTNTDYSMDLGVDVSDSEGHELNVSFYNRSDKYVDSDIVSGSGRASITWNGLEPGTNYNWYAEADDGRNITKTVNYSFTTNQPITLASDSQSFVNYSANHQYSTTAYAEDLDGEGDVTTCKVYWEEPDGNSGLIDVEPDTSAGDSTYLKCETTISTALNGVNAGENIGTSIRFFDGESWDNTTIQNHQIPNNPPQPPDTFSRLGGFLTDHEPEISWIGSYDPDGDSVTIEAYTGTTEEPVSLDSSASRSDDNMSLGQNVTLEDGKSYYYRLRACDNIGSCSDYTSSEKFRMNQKPVIQSFGINKEKPELGDVLKLETNVTDRNLDSVKFTMWENETKLFDTRTGSLDENWSVTFTADQPTEYNYSIIAEDNVSETTKVNGSFNIGYKRSGTYTKNIDTSRKVQEVKPVVYGDKKDGSIVLEASTSNSEKKVVSNNTWNELNPGQDLEFAIKLTGDGRETPRVSGYQLFYRTEHKTSGNYLSKVKNLNYTVQITELDFRGSEPEDTEIDYEYRTGKDSLPPSNWTDWKQCDGECEPYEFEGKYVQFRVSMTGKPTETPELNSIKVEYQ